MFDFVFGHSSLACFGDTICERYRFITPFDVLQVLQRILPDFACGRAERTGKAFAAYLRLQIGSRTPATGGLKHF
jgi:hypothetical protein